MIGWRKDRGVGTLPGQTGNSDSPATIEQISDSQRGESGRSPARSPRRRVVHFGGAPVRSAIASKGPAGVFPMNALVDCDDACLALLLCSIDRRIGGVLLRGAEERTKRAAAQAVASLYPGQAPFIELPPGAQAESILGFPVGTGAGDGRSPSPGPPGLLEQAKGGVLFADRITRLAPELVEVMLKVAATGTATVEVAGSTYKPASCFLLVASTRPGEGGLSPDLLDGFGLSVEVDPPQDPARRAAASRRFLEFEADPTPFAGQWKAQEAALRSRLSGARPSPLARGLEERVAELCSDAGGSGLGADITLCRAAAALAGWEGDSETVPAHVARVAPLVLSHRHPAPASPLAAAASGPVVTSGDAWRGLDDRPGISGSRDPTGDEHVVGGLFDRPLSRRRWGIAKALDRG